MKSLKVEWVIVTLKRLVDERIWQTHRKKITVIFIFFASDPVSYLKVSENLKVSWSIENVGRRSVDFADCRRPENRPPNDALSSGGIFD